MDRSIVKQCSDRRLPCPQRERCTYPLLPFPEIYRLPESYFPDYFHCPHSSHRLVPGPGLTPPHVQPLPHHSSFLLHRASRLLSIQVSARLPSAAAPLVGIP